MRSTLRLAIIGSLCFLPCSMTSQFSVAQDAVANAPAEPKPVELATVSPGTSIAPLITQYSADQRTLDHRFRLPLDTIGQEYRTKMLQNWADKLKSTNFAGLSQDDQIDWLLLNEKIRHDGELLDRKLTRNAEAQPLIPYAELLLKYCSSKDHGVPLTAEKAAEVLDAIATQATGAAKALQKPAKDKEPKTTDAGTDAPAVAPTAAIYASTLLDQFSRQLQDTHKYHEGYDPKYTWWAAKPFEAAKLALTSHRKAIREKLAGLDDADPDKIVGLPIGNEALLKDLRNAWIPYTPEELVAIGEKELQWCDEQFKIAADELKLDGDWRKALESVKTLHVEPGDQPRLIRELAWEAIRFIEGHDLLVIPEMAKQGWRVEMMTPEAQRVNPYFLGGDNIIVSFPTNTMTHSEKLMSLKSNNIHFSRATVHHELIPGHHLQYYSLARFKPYREAFESPFWMEGWALYWEMLLWDAGFAQSPEDKVGMLFWRRHRAARIIFSLNYQTGKWTADECVKYLIDRVGHEPSAAAAEVRRSVMGGYGPLYQAGYMLGGLQLRALHRELVLQAGLPHRVFHDAVLRENYLPFELLRAKLLSIPLTPEFNSTWKFYEQP